jgi:hypothetical protein
MDPFHPRQLAMDDPIAWDRRIPGTLAQYALAEWKDGLVTTSADAVNLIAPEGPKSVPFQSADKLAAGSHLFVSTRDAVWRFPRTKLLEGELVALTDPWALPEGGAAALLAKQLLRSDRKKPMRLPFEVVSSRSNGRVVASRTSKDELVIWNPDTGRVQHRRPITPKEYAFDGERHLAVADYDKEVHVLDLESGRTLSRFARVGDVDCLGFCGDALVIANHARTTRVWDWRKKKPRFSLLEHGDFLTAIVARKGLIVTTSWDGAIRFFDPADGHCRGFIMQYHEGWLAMNAERQQEIFGKKPKAVRYGYRENAPPGYSPFALRVGRLTSGVLARLLG